MPKKNVEDQYEDFYERAFSDVDIDKIYEEGGAINISNFMSAAKDNIKDAGYFRVLKYTVKKTQRYRSVGGLLWERYFKDENIRKNVKDRVIVNTGKKFEFEGKEYKGGMFVPKSYLVKNR